MQLQARATFGYKDSKMQDLKLRFINVGWGPFEEALVFFFSCAQNVRKKSECDKAACEYLKLT